MGFLVGIFLAPLAGFCGVWKMSGALEGLASSCWSGCLYEAGDALRYSSLR